MTTDLTKVETWTELGVHSEKFCVGMSVKIWNGLPPSEDVAHVKQPCKRELDCTGCGEQKRSLEEELSIAEEMRYDLQDQLYDAEAETEELNELRDKLVQSQIKFENEKAKFEQTKRNWFNKVKLQKYRESLAKAREERMNKKLLDKKKPKPKKKATRKGTRKSKRTPKPKTKS